MKIFIKKTMVILISVLFAFVLFACDNQTQELSDKIDSLINSATVDDYDLLCEIKNEYEQLNEGQKEKIENYDTFLELYTKIENERSIQTLVNEFENKINDATEQVVAEDYKKLIELQNEYKKLDEKVKDKITNYHNLELAIEDAQTLTYIDNAEKAFKNKKYKNALASYSLALDNIKYYTKIRTAVYDCGVILFDLNEYELAKSYFEEVDNDYCKEYIYIIDNIYLHNYTDKIDNVVKKIQEYSDDGFDVAKKMLNNDSFIVKTYFEKALNLSQDDPDVSSIRINDFVAWYYKNMAFSIDSDEWINNRFGNRSGSISPHDLYTSVGGHIAEFSDKTTDYAAFSQILIGYVPKTNKEFAPYVNNVKTIIKEKATVQDAVKPFDGLKSVKGTFDYNGRSGSHDFTISNLQLCAEELGISEEMLGYIIAAFTDAGAKIDFTSTSCHIVITNPKSDDNNSTNPVVLNETNSNTTDDSTNSNSSTVDDAPSDKTSDDNTDISNDEDLEVQETIIEDINVFDFIIEEPAEQRITNVLDQLEEDLNKSNYQYHYDNGNVYVFNEENDFSFSYYFYDPDIDESKESVIRTHREIVIGSTMRDVADVYGDTDVYYFDSQNNELYLCLLEDDPVRADIMYNQCKSYISYPYEDVGNIEFYFDENDTVSWIVFYLNKI